MEDKKFLTYEQQVQKLYDKKLEISNYFFKIVICK